MNNAIKLAIETLEKELNSNIETANWYHKKFKEYEIIVTTQKETIAELKAYAGEKDEGKTK